MALDPHGPSSHAGATSFQSSPAPESSQFEIKEWPKHLRSDLRGTSIKIVLPENALDRLWDDALMAKFQQLTGIMVQTVRPGNDTTAVLASYLRDLATGSADADVYAIDIVWPGILSEYAEDLRPTIGRLQDMLPTLVQNDTVKGKLVAVPYFTEVSILYYRSDLLEKYHFSQPPLTWGELEQPGTNDRGWGAGEWQQLVLGVSVARSGVGSVDL